MVKIVNGEGDLLAVNPAPYSLQKFVVFFRTLSNILTLSEGNNANLPRTLHGEKKTSYCPYCTGIEPEIKTRLTRSAGASQTGWCLYLTIYCDCGPGGIMINRLLDIHFSSILHVATHHITFLYPTLALYNNNYL